MSEVVDALEDPDRALAAAEAALSRGGVVVLPTDTVYGVGARPDVPEATSRLFAAKRRPRELTLPVLVAGVDDAARVASVDDRARSLAERFWPGPLTLVLPRTEWSRGWDLGSHRETVGIRVPAHPVALALLRRTGPLAVTSANRSGEDTPPTCRGVRAALGEAVDVYLCAGSAGGVASTVVDLTGGEPALLRAGGLPWALVRSGVDPR